MKYDLGKIKEALKNKEISLLLGYGPGRNEYTTVPMVFKRLEDFNKLKLNHFCNHNLVTYLIELAKEPASKLAIMVKPCDGKSLVELQRENQFRKDNVVIISLPCEGIIDLKKVRALQKENTESIRNITIEADKATIGFAERNITVDLLDIVSNKCLECELKTSPIYDELLGEANPPATKQPKGNAKMALEDGEQQREYWLQQYESCIRCGACRKVCPMCYCETCVFEQPKSAILEQQASKKDNGIFLMGRAMHLAGRCTNCGRCSEVCPVSIDHDGINKPLAQYVLDTFEIKAGEQNDKAPLFSAANMNESEDFPEHK